jgi:transcriptional regulator GlxA family with amidase domain
VQADCSFEEAPDFDTIIVPGGSGMRDSARCSPIVEWLKMRAPQTRRVASTCVGMFPLAYAGLLDGRRATTHWRFAQDAIKRFPQVRIEPDAIFIRDGKISTSAGVTAGVDLALSLVSEDLGEATALAVARDLVVYLKRPGGQMQFSEPLQFQMRASDRFADLAGWIIRNLRSDLSIEALAKRVALSPRQFSRRFKSTFGVSPADYVEKLRLEEARERLSSTHQSIDHIGRSVGYANCDVFRRAFERTFGATPKIYRESFGIQDPRSSSEVTQPLLQQSK